MITYQKCLRFFFVYCNYFEITQLWWLPCSILSKIVRNISKKLLFLFPSKWSNKSLRCYQKWNYHNFKFWRKKMIINRVKVKIIVVIMTHAPSYAGYSQLGSCRQWGRWLTSTHSACLKRKRNKQTTWVTVATRRSFHVQAKTTN